MNEVTDVLLANMIAHAAMKLSALNAQAQLSAPSELDKLDAEFWSHNHAALTELQRRRASPQWVEWRHGDQVPPDGIYWATIRYTTDEGNPNTVPRVEEIQSGWGEWQTYSEVHAYWSMPRPSPYTPDTKGQA